MEVKLQEAMNNTRFFNTDHSTIYGRMIVNEYVTPPEVMVIVMKDGQKIEPIVKQPIKTFEVGEYLVGDEPAASLILKVLEGLDR